MYAQNWHHSNDSIVRIDVSSFFSCSNCRSFLVHVIVIKSLCVRRLASSLVSFSEVWQSDEEMRSRIL